MKGKNENELKRVEEEKLIEWWGEWFTPFGVW